MSKLDLPEDTTEPSSFLVELQSIVTKRSFKTLANAEPIIYEFTQDPALLHQYYCLRKIMYDKVFKVEDYNWGEDYYDKLSSILIARRGRLCIGGCRLIIREPDEMWSLPMEIDGLNIRQSFPSLPLNQVRHAEISRLTVMEDNGDDGVFWGLCRAMYDKVMTSDINYLFVVSLYNMARNWRFVANSFGVKTTKIIENLHPIDTALDPSIKWYLIVSDLTSFCGDNLLGNNGGGKLHNKVFETLN